MSEKEEAVRLANAVLEKPYIDPDGDISVLARQFLRAREEIDAMRDALVVADRVMRFDLRRMIVMGPDFNQAVTDAANAIYAVINKFTVPQVGAAKAIGIRARPTDTRALDISSEAVAERAELLRRDGTAPVSAVMLEALAADRDRLAQELFQSRKFWSGDADKRASENRAKDATIARLSADIALTREALDRCFALDPDGARAVLAKLSEGA